LHIDAIFANELLSHEMKKEQNEPACRQAIDSPHFFSEAFIYSSDPLAISERSVAGQSIIRRGEISWAFNKRFHEACATHASCIESCKNRNVSPREFISK